MLSDFGYQLAELSKLWTRLSDFLGPQKFLSGFTNPFVEVVSEFSAEDAQVVQLVLYD